MGFTMFSDAAPRKSVIESIGVYLPPKVVTTAELRRSCRHPLKLPLERLTGIESRHVAGDGTFSIDLAKHAVGRCFAMSKHQPSDLDLLICCNMSRYDGPGFRYSVEPSASIRLKRHFGCRRALTFDVGNACAGMFTAIKIADTLLRSGQIETAMIASGEYVTHVTRTAQLEIVDHLDARLACLTLGDSGVAIILESAGDDHVGFHALDLYTAGAYWHYGVARPTTEEHGGAIMLTESAKLHEVAIRHSASHIVKTLKDVQWTKDDLHHVILHQTAKSAFSEATRQVNALAENAYFCDEKMVDNLAARGNTATTTHLLAAWDSMLAGRIRTGDNVIFGIQASGLAIGTAAYTFDDLPDRVRGERTSVISRNSCRRPGRIVPRATRGTKRIRLESLGVADVAADGAMRGLSLAQGALDHCLVQSTHQREDIELLIYAGVHRDDFAGEPAMAAMVAARAGLNETGVAENGKRTVAWDLSNGAVGFFHACYAAAGFLASGAYKTAMVVASEVENNARLAGRALLGLAEVGSAAILDLSPDDAVGFGEFAFTSFDGHLDSFASWLVQEGGRTSLAFSRDERFEAACIHCISAAVEEALRKEGLSIEDVDVILPPQISGTFVARLSDKLMARNARIVNLRTERDLYSSSIVHSMQHARAQGWMDRGTVGLIIGAGAGIQAGCAVYFA